MSAAIALPGGGANAAVKVPKTVATVGLGPEPKLELSGSAWSALPGDRLDYQAKVTNQGTQLVFSGGTKVRNTRFAEGEIAYFSYYVTYYSMTQRKWINLAGYESKKPG